MELEWESNFETGNETVDLQHRYFVDLINRVGENFRETDDADYKAKRISELGKDADFHFTSEENIATSCNLPGVSGHHLRHAELVEEFKHHAAKKFFQQGKFVSIADFFYKTVSFYYTVALVLISTIISRIHPLLLLITGFNNNARRLGF